MVGRVKKIESPQNPLIRELVKLRENNRYRRKGERFSVEGLREIKRAVDHGFLLETLLVRTGAIASAEKGSELATLWEQALDSDAQLVEVSARILEAMTVRDGDGVLAVFAKKQTSLDDLDHVERPFFLVASGVEKPGNLGAMIRSGDGAGIDSMIIVDGLVDAFHPHVIRASIGSVFSLPLVSTDMKTLVAYCQRRQIQLIASALWDRCCDYADADFSKSTAIVLGAEDHGLDSAWIDVCDFAVKIPMHGVGDSLNVSTAAAILCYEAARQRRD